MLLQLNDTPKKFFFLFGIRKQIARTNSIHLIQLSVVSQKGGI